MVGYLIYALDLVTDSTIIQVVFGDYDLTVDLLEVCDVRDDAYQAITFCQLVECLESLLEGVLIEGSETFVNEHGIELDATCRLLYLVGEAKRE